MAGYDAEIRVRTSLDSKNFEAGADQIQHKLSEIEEGIDTAKAKLKALEEMGIPKKSRLYQDAVKDLAKWTAELEASNRKQRGNSSHMNQLRVDVEEYAQSLKELEKEGKYFGDADYDKLYLYWRNATDEVKKYQAELNKKSEKGIAEEAEKTARAIEKQEAAQRRLAAQEERRLQKESAQIQRESEKQAKIQAQEAEEQRIAQIKANATVSDQKIVALLERKRQLVAEIRDLERAGVTAGYREYDSRQAELNSIKKQLSGASDLKKTLSGMSTVGKKASDILTKVGISAKGSFKELSDGSKRSSGLLSTFTSRLKGIALSLLIFNWISKGFNAMIAGMKQGFTNLMGYSSEYASSVQSLKNAMATLGNSFAAAFAPIVQMVIPWLTQLISAISTAITYVSQFIAILGGKSTFIKAKKIQDAYNMSLGGTAKAADKARGALAKFDDLDVLEKKQDTDYGGGTTTPENMFEEVPVDSEFKNWLDEILKKLKPILDYIGKMKDAFMDGFWDGLGDYQYRFEAIGKGLQQIKDALIDIWTDPDVLAAVDAWMMSLMYMFGSLVGAIASIGLTIAAAFIGGLGQYMEDNVDRIKKFLISAFNIGTEINNLLAGLLQSIAYIFEAFASESGIRFAAALIGSLVDASMGMQELALKLGRDILQMLILPITENQDGFRAALEGMLSSAATVLEGLKLSIDSLFDNLNKVYDENFKPFFDSIATGLSAIVSKFLEVWNGNIQPILDNAANKISDLLANYITPFFNSVVTFIGGLVDMLAMLWEMVEPHVEWLISYAVPLLGEIFNSFYEQIMAIIMFVMDGFNAFMDLLNTYILPVWKENWNDALAVIDFFAKGIELLIELVTDIIVEMPKIVQKTIQGGWKKSWEEAQKIFTTFKDKIFEIVDLIKNTLAQFFEWIGEKVSAVIQGIKNIGSAFSGSEGTSAAKTSKGSMVRSFMAMDTASAQTAIDSIPHLASGAVIRGGNPFLAVLGDQRTGQTNIEAPISTIEQAVENVMSRRGYGISMNPVVSLNLDGQEFARLTLQDILQEAKRQGYDVDILGVT